MDLDMHSKNFKSFFLLKSGTKTMNQQGINNEFICTV